MATEHDTSFRTAGGCAGLAVLSLIVFSSFLLNTCVSQTEVARSISPDEELVARLVEVDGGATTDFLYTIHVRRNWFLPLWEYHVGDLYGAVRSKCAYGVNLRWGNDRTLVAEYLEAKWTDVKPKADILGRPILIKLAPHTLDNGAPCGGMEYGQRH